MLIKSSYILRLSLLKNSEQYFLSYKRIMNLPDCKKVFVWKNGDGKKVQVHLLYPDKNGRLNQIFMNRPCLDSFASTKRRMEDKLANVSAAKRQKSTDNELGNVKIEPCGIDLEEETTNHDVFYGCTTLTIGSVEYSIVRDLPMLTKLSISVTPIVDCPVIASCDWKDGIQPINVQFHWFIAEESKDLLIERNNTSGKVQLKDWIYVCDGPIFYPAKEHTGFYLSVVVDYGEDMLVKASQTTSSIIDIDEELIFEKRQTEFCNSLLSKDKFRLVCYNVLADLYLNLKLEQSRLFFSYCPSTYQDSTYRYPLVLKELKGYNGDLFCLQEVDQRMQVRYLTRFLQHNGFITDFKSKANAVNEGLFIAFNPKKFRMVEFEWNSDEKFFHGIRISNLLNTELFPENVDITEFLNKNPATMEYFRTRPTVLQMVLLESIGNPHVRLLVGNTHLIFDPAYEHVKLLQILLIARYICRMRRLVEENVPDKNLYSLLCGDFNSTPDSGVVELLQSGKIEAISSYWGSNIAEGIDMNTNCKYKCLTGFPEYTNYTQSPNTRGFIGCLDYVWCQPEMFVERILPLPNHELVSKYGAIPSKIAPSDHLALVVDLNLEKKCSI